MATATKRTTTRKAAPKKTEPEPDLLAGLDEPAANEVDESELDLLEGITEDNGTAWMPWEEEDQPHGIQGTVMYIGTVGSDYDDEVDVPLIELADKSDPELIWSIRGYSTALRNQIQKTNPQVGDIFAVKYLGEKPSKRSGKDYHNFKAAVQHR